MVRTVLKAVSGVRSLIGRNTHREFTVRLLARRALNVVLFAPLVFRATPWRVELAMGDAS
jgi:hypothetical protein